MHKKGCQVDDTDRKMETIQVGAERVELGKSAFWLMAI